MKFFFPVEVKDGQTSLEYEAVRAVFDKIRANPESCTFMGGREYCYIYPKVKKYECQQMHVGRYGMEGDGGMYIFMIWDGVNIRTPQIRYPNDLMKDIISWVNQYIEQKHLEALVNIVAPSRAEEIKNLFQS